MQEKAVIISRVSISHDRDNEVEFGPKKYAHDRHRIRPVFVHQHQKNHASNDAGMRNEKAEKSEIGKTVRQIGGQNCLQGSANAPEIRHLKPALISRQHRDDHDDHSPIAKLKRQNLLPADRPELPDQTHEYDVVHHQQGR